MHSIYLIIVWLFLMVIVAFLTMGKWIGKYDNRLVEMMVYRPLKHYVFPPIDQTKKLTNRQRALLARILNKNRWSSSTAHYSLTIGDVSFDVYPNGEVDSITAKKPEDYNLVSNVDSIDKLLIEEARRHMAALHHLFNLTNKEN